MKRIGASLAALTLVLWACEDRRDVYLGAIASGVGGQTTAGQGGSGVCDGSCASLSCTNSADDQAAASALFTSAESQPPGSDAAREPAIVYPNHETKLPSNLGRIYCEWSPGADNTLFELELRGSATRLVYVSEPHWTLSDADWLALAEQNQGGSLTLRVRAINPRAPERAFESQPITLYIDAPLLDAPIYYWSTTAHGLMRARLGAANPERLSTPVDTGDAGSCAGCHSISRDGSRLAFDTGGALRVAKIADLTPALLSGGSGGAGPGPGKMMDKVGPDAPAAWSAFSPDGTRIVQALNGALTLLDANGAPLGPGAGNIALPGKSVGTYPDWSPTGDRLVFTLAEKGNGRAVERGQIASMAFDADHFGAAEILVASQAPDDNNLFPALSPDGKFVAYVNTRGKSENATAAELRLLRLADKQTFTLPRLNRRAQGVDDASGIGNSMPTWAPSSDPTHFWLAFSSVRAYGSLRPQDKKSDQLWLAAIDPSASDPSFAAFWAPFQQLDHSNHRALWGASGVAASCDCSPSACLSACAAREICGDGIDNDYDCLVDDCPLVENCSDGVDNDGDGLVDAADPTCMKP